METRNRDYLVVLFCAMAIFAICLGIALSAGNSSGNDSSILGSLLTETPLPTPTPIPFFNVRTDSNESNNCYDNSIRWQEFEQGEGFDWVSINGTEKGPTVRFHFFIASIGNRAIAVDHIGIINEGQTLAFSLRQGRDYGPVFKVLFVSGNKVLIALGCAGNSPQFEETWDGSTLPYEPYIEIVTATAVPN